MQKTSSGERCGAAQAWASLGEAACGFRIHIVAAGFFCMGFLCAAAPARAQPTAAMQGSPGSPAASAPSQLGTTLVASCDRPSSPRIANNGPISVTVNAATAWQPRGGEVLIAIKGDQKEFVGLNFRACFAWSTAQAENYFSPEKLGNTSWEEGFVLLRPSDQTGLINVGVIVPPLPLASSGLVERWSSAIRSTGLGLVPVVDMRLIVYTKDGIVLDEVRPIGVTSITYALLVTVAALGMALTILHRLAAIPAPQPSSFLGRLKAAISGRWVLTLVQAPDGHASLAAFQILLWTLVVAASAVFVMTLSGNLINVTLGTLTLLGIAGASGLIAAGFADNSTRPNRATQAANPPVPVLPAPAQSIAEGPGPVIAQMEAAGVAVPQWRDFILNDSRLPDISRIQMLLFTVVGAAFVILQVLNYFVIPDIPTGYQLLIGVSNGVYVGRKFKGSA